MLPRTIITIHLLEGVTAKLLLTPALYGVAKERRIDLFKAKEEGEERSSWLVEQYSKIAYCAAISAWEVDAVDNPDVGDFPFTYEDFFTWAWSNAEEFAKTVNAILEALTGKSVEDYVREARGGDDVGKKKAPAAGTGTRSLQRFLIMRRSKNSS